jgi:SSS family solute:Na+ symporter
MALKLSFLDIIVFITFIAAVIGIGIYKSRKEKFSSEGYFLAGRGLSWWLIGFSLIAANISTEQFVGMSGQAASGVGLAIASYEWMAAITLVFVAFFFLPKFLKSGIFTIPEYLEYRYNSVSRSIMAGYTMIIYVFVTIAAVIYSGGITIHTVFRGQSLLGIPINVTTACWMIGILASIYVATGGLKACAWADLIQGAALIIGGAIVMFLAIDKVGQTEFPQLVGTAAEKAGGVTKFMALNKDKMHMFLPASNSVLPWTALMIGLWIPNFYYWGLNQYITQRALGAKSVKEGQKGTLFAAGLKLIIPFIIVIPGIIAFNLYHKDMAQEAMADNTIAWAKYEAVKARPGDEFITFKYDQEYKKLYPQNALELDAHNQQVEEKANLTKKEVSEETLIGYKYDSAYGLLLRKLIPIGLCGLMFAAIAGAVMSSLASMLNSASTIFTMDIYRKFIKKDASQKNLVGIGRMSTLIFVVIGCLIAPLLGDPSFKGIFNYIQEFQGFISPGILAAFIFGLFIKRAPGSAGVAALVLSPIVYGLLKVLYAITDITFLSAFLNRMALTFGLVILVMTILTLLKPLSEPRKMPVREGIQMESSKLLYIAGILIVVATIALYIIFR